MSSTRRASEHGEFRQERYMSSPEFERGLLANIVARRVEVLDCPEDRELIWFIQRESWRNGLPAIARELMKQHPEADAAKTLVRSKRESYEDMLGSEGWMYESAASALPKFLAELCLNPERQIEADPYWFKGLIPLLRKCMADTIQRKRAEFVLTEIGELVFESLDYALDGRCMTLTDGAPRTGKSKAAEQWCDLHPGTARYVQLTGTNDEKSFHYAIAKALGVSINLNSKAQELRQRNEDVLQRSGLMLVIDEAHYLWPSQINPRCLPTRVNWIMTALVNHHVPVALITTPQFLKSQKAVEEATRWTGEQFTGRIGHYQPLPTIIPDRDLAAVARALLPDADEAMVRGLVKYAQGSSKYLAAIESCARRATYLAKRAGRSKVTRLDVANAIEQSVIPSDTALAKAMQQSARKPRRPVSATPSAQLQEPFQGAEERMQNRLPALSESRPACISV